jgi:glutamine cyclotransferase
MAAAVFFPALRPAFPAGLEEESGVAPRVFPRVVNRMPHRPDRFTQGLFFSGGFLYESAGLYGQSGLYRLDPGTGRTLLSLPLPGVFLEGAAAQDGIIHLLTWRDGLRFRLDENDFSVRGVHPLAGEGWGLCRAGAFLWLSDGSAVLRRVLVLENGGWAEEERLLVTDDGRPVPRLNELEWVDGLLFANVWLSSLIAVLDPARKNPRTGECPVLFWLDCSVQAAPHLEANPDAVLNGIAWDPASGRLLITGKLWPFFYEISLPPSPWEPPEGKQGERILCGRPAAMRKHRPKPQASCGARRLCLRRESGMDYYNMMN